MMRGRSLPRLKAAFAIGLAGVLWAGQACATELHVMSSGGLTAAFKSLIPLYEQTSGNKIDLVLGPSMGTAEDAIPVRLKRGEPADVLLMVGYSLGDLVKQGIVERKIDLAESRMGLAVKEGAPVPDISTLDAFKKALLSAPSIAYSDSASGVYIEREMYRKLGLQDQLAPKSRMIISERVGNVVARGEAAFGFQQMSELVPVKGITVVGPIPAEAQSITMFSGGVPTNAKEKAAAQNLLTFLQGPQAVKAMKDSGLDPVGKD